MKLSEKGHYAPPPALPKHAAVVAEAIAAWPDVHPRTHWLLGDESTVDGADFYVGDDEIGHIHLYAEAHVAVSPKVRSVLIEVGAAEPFQWSRAFVVSRIKRASDIERATAIFRLAYDRRAGVPESELIERARKLGSANAADSAVA